MHDFVNIVNKLEDGMLEVLRVTTMIRQEAVLIYDPIIGKDWIKGILKNSYLASPNIDMCREKKSSETLPAPLILQFRSASRMFQASPHIYTLYYDLLKSEVFIRTSASLSVDKDVYFDYSVKQWLKELVHGVDWNDDNSTKRYSTMRGQPLYEDVGYTDITVPLALSETCNI